VLSRIGVAVEECLSGDQETRGTDPTLERSVFEEFLLERMKLVSLCQTFDRLNVFALRLDPKDETRTGNPSIENDTAGAAVTGETAFFGPGEPKDIAQHFE
jgi:hypothetical protein